MNDRFEKWTIANSFHGTTITLRVRASDERGPHAGTWAADAPRNQWVLFTDNQVARAKRALCPVRNCKCWGFFKEHGPEEKA